MIGLMYEQCKGSVAGPIKNEVHLTSKGGGKLSEIFQHCQYRFKCVQYHYGQHAIDTTCFTGN